MIDTHVHIFERHLPAAPGARYVPGYDATLDHLQAEWRSHGISSGVLVQPSFLGIDNAYLLTACAQHPESLRAVVVIAEQTTDEALVRMHAQGARGIRFNWWGQSSEPPLSSLDWQRIVHQLVQLNWHVELHVEAARLPLALSQLADWPLTLVIDHLGRPDEQTDLQAHVRMLQAASHRRELRVKLSAPYRMSAQAWTSLSERLLGDLGSERLLWGSDWPWTQHEGQHRYRDMKEAWQRAVPNEAERLQMDQAAQSLYF
jgi:predicted TIM-barrel fold metal-dependent hydrolase